MATGELCVITTGTLLMLWLIECHELGNLQAVEAPRSVFFGAGSGPGIMLCIVQGQSVQNLQSSFKLVFPLRPWVAVKTQDLLFVLTVTAWLVWAKRPVTSLQFFSL